MVAPGGTVTVALNAEAVSPGIGAFTVDVAYDDARLDYVGCTAHASGLCNKTANGNVRFTGASAVGISGSLLLGTVTFIAGAEEGVAALDVTIDTLTDPDGNVLIVTPVDGVITIATPPGGVTPAPSPTATATPTPMGAFAVGIESATVEPGGTVTVALNAEAVSPGIGAFTVDVAYDDARLDFVSCTGHASGLCAKTANGPVRFTGASAVGISGLIVLGTVTFNASAEEGIVPLDVTIDTLTDPEGRDLTVIPTDGAITIATVMPTPTPTATPTPSPAPVPGAPPPFDPGGVICFENLESPPECDGDSSPGAAADIRSKHCVGWNSDCSMRDSPVFDSNFGGFLSFTPPEWSVPAGNTIPVGAIAGRIDAEGWLGILNNACNSRIGVEFTMLNASIDTGQLISTAQTGDPMAPLAIDANGNGVPDGADEYPAFLANFLPGVQPRARLFGITHIQGSWMTVNTLVFDQGATLTIGGTSVTFDPRLGYPSGTILQDPTAQAAPGWITDFCAPFFAQDVVLGKTINNPCSPVRVAGANCPVTSNVLPESREHGYPALPCDVRTTFDDDGDGAINDGCPQVNTLPEVGAECDNAISDDLEDSSINDGCPQVGDVSEGTRIPGSCSGGDEGGCTYRSNPAAAGPATFTTLNLSQRDADGDGIENGLDVCAVIPNGGWDPRANDFINDPDNDGLPSVCDPNPNQAGPPSPGGCASGYTGADEDMDCFSNRADNCPNHTQLQNPGFPPDRVSNKPFAPDQDRDGIGDVCDPNPTAPNGNIRALCLKFALGVGGTSGPVVGVLDPVPGLDCVANASAPPVATPTPPAGVTPGPSPTPTATPTPMPAPTATPTPTPAPPIDVEVEIEETGTVGRSGSATIRGSLECSVPSFVDLAVEVRQRGGKARTEGVAVVSLWCDGHERWKAKVEPEDGEFRPGKATVSVQADAHIGGQAGEDDETERVHLKSKHHKERDCDSDWEASPGGRRCREVDD